MTDSSLQRYLDTEGRVTIWPKKHAAKELVIEYLASKFAFDSAYHEAEVNQLLRQWHTFYDWPLLRRELFERGYLDRNKSGTNYTRLK